MDECITEEQQARFWSCVDKNGPIHPALGTRCWVWTGGTTNQGYGKFRVGRRAVGASRVSLALDGRPPGDLLACHHCDNPPCVRPDHLFVGTYKQNSEDCVRKGRQHTGPVRRLMALPLDEDEMALFDATAAEAGMTRKQLADDIGVRVYPASHDLIEARNRRQAAM